MQDIALITAEIIFLVIGCLFALIFVVFFALLIQKILNELSSSENSFIYRSFMFIALFVLAGVSAPSIVLLLHLVAHFTGSLF